MQRITFTWLISSALLSACYSPSIPNGTQQCAPGGLCAEGYVCGNDNRCYRSGQQPKGDGGARDSGVGDAGVAFDLAMPDLTKLCQGDGDCGGQTPRCDVTSGLCVACLPAMDNCAKGTFCGQMNGVYMCQSGCNLDGDCAAPDGGPSRMACCNHVCVNQLVDAMNCGACGKSCGNGTCCAAVCADTTMDLANCGMCGNGCAGSRANWSCTASMCAVASCTGSFLDCNMKPADGCEVNGAGDPNNCTKCGNVCSAPNAAQMGCANGCFIAQCKPSFGDCDGVVANGCEANLLTDSANCGGCKKPCAQGTTCVNGICQGGIFPSPSYAASFTFKDATGSTVMNVAYDGLNYWTVSGGSSAGNRYAKYDAQGANPTLFAPNIDFRAAFTHGGNTSPVFIRGISSNVIQVQTQPGMFAASVTLVGGTIDAQANVAWNENGSELFTMQGGTVNRWNAQGAFLGTLALQGFGTLNTENTYPQNRGIVKAGGYYLTYSMGTLSAWDGNGVRVKTTVLTGAGTSFDSYFSLSYANKMVFVVDAGNGTWRGYNVGL